MNIIGINRLGINPAACLLQNGNLKAFAAEERFNRYKESFGLMPAAATSFCLESASLSINDIDAIAFGWDANLYSWHMPFFFAKNGLLNSNFQSDEQNAFKALEQLIRYRPSNVKKVIAEMLRSKKHGSKLPEIYFLNHHLSHAASAYYSSSFESAHILVVDGSGENQCTSIFHAAGKDITLIETFKIPHSLGWFYQSITEWLGFSSNKHEGKTMALAAFGKPNAEVENKLQLMLQHDGKGNYMHNPQYSFAGNHLHGNVFSEKLTALLGKPRTSNEPLSDYHHDIAYAAQHLLEEVIVAIVKRISCYKNFNGNLCLPGGVTLNCKMNGVVAQMDEVKKLFVPPVCSDDGTALGAAQLVAVKKQSDPRSEMLHPYYGPTYDNADIEKVLKQAKIPYAFHENI